MQEVTPDSQFGVLLNSNDVRDSRRPLSDAGNQQSKVPAAMSVGTWLSPACHIGVHGILIVL